jgi:hypothetical protein
MPLRKRFEMRKRALFSLSDIIDNRVRRNRAGGERIKKVLIPPNPAVQSSAVLRTYVGRTLEKSNLN